MLFTVTYLANKSEDADKAIVDNKSKVTEDQLRAFIQLCWVKYVKAMIEPGEFALSSMLAFC